MTLANSKRDFIGWTHYALISSKTIVDIALPTWQTTSAIFCEEQNWVLYVVALVVAGLSKQVADAETKLTAALSVRPSVTAKLETRVAPRNIRKLAEVLFTLITPFCDTKTSIVLVADCGVIVAVKPVSINAFVLLVADCVVVLPVTTCNTRNAPRKPLT